MRDRQKGLRDSQGGMDNWMGHMCQIGPHIDQFGACKGKSRAETCQLGAHASQLRNKWFNSGLIWSKWGSYEPSFDPYWSILYHASEYWLYLCPLGDHIRVSWAK